MTTSSSGWLRTWALRTCIFAAIGFAVWSSGGLTSAFAQKEKSPPHTPEEHSREVIGLKQAFGGSQVDLYFEVGEFDSMKAGLAGVKFVDVVDVTGKELLRFERGADSWLIDPDTVFAYRLHSKSK
jgi:hypothetical protein